MIAPSVMNLTALPAFADNCIWMIDDGARAIVVDPGESGPAAEALDARRLELAAILVTHHHADHVAGAARRESTPLSAIGRASRGEPFMRHGKNKLR